MTVNEAHREAVRRLCESGVESPNVDAEWLISELISCARSEIAINEKRELSQEEQCLLSDQLVRRERREPLQSILGTTSFFGFDFCVGPEALIPRPETESLVEHAIQFVKHHPSSIVLDLGTGSGCIAIALAKFCPGTKILASDLHGPALKLAKQNAMRLNALRQITFCQADGMAALAKNESVDLIVSNPPYIPTSEISTLQPEVRKHDPPIALDGGADGLYFYRQLAIEGFPRLKKKGQLIAEFGDGQATAVTEVFRQVAWANVEIKNDLVGRKRIVIASTGF
tara:strand:+ start:1691 stop:2542 length:852 start_codon:yes stop_codon:yes gene_type:complete